MGQVESHIQTEAQDRGDPRASVAHWKRAWKASRSGATANRILREIETVVPDSPLRPVRLKVLRSYTVEPIIPWLRAEALLHDLNLDVDVGGFGSFAHEILADNSELYQEQYDVMLLATQTRDWSAALWSQFADLDPEKVFEERDRVLRDIETLIAAVRSRTTATLLVTNFDQPAVPCLGLADRQAECGQIEVLTEMNRRLAAIVRRSPAVHLIDYDGLTARFGRKEWVNEGQWQTTRLPVASAHIGDLASAWVRYLRAVTLPARKVLVTDLDNTLWGGILGEDGLNGIIVGKDHPGWRYREVQRALLDLHRRGILLAIASKNDEAEALECIDSHPEMLLRSKDFAAIRINWNDKAQSVDEIARELSVGTDSLVFLDDNPVERENMRVRRPEVHVLDLPEDPAAFAAALRDDTSFDSLVLTEDDRDRNRYYAEHRKRRAAQVESQTRDEFLEILAQKVTIAPADDRSVVRIAELTRKTNQLNMTTRRYAQGEIQALVQDKGVAVLSVRVEDRFGDNGVVGVLILRRTDARVEIDTFLLSCRVIGRSLEPAILSYVARFCEEWGAKEVVGWYRPTTKNGPAATVYSDCGFRKVEQDPEGDTLWRLDLASALPTTPASIEIHGEVPVHG